jgi:hypothetical protein
VLTVARHDVICHPYWRQFLESFIHLSDIKTRVIHEAGWTRVALCLRRRSYEGGRKIQARKKFYMYSEEALGPCVQSATIIPME